MSDVVVRLETVKIIKTGGLQGVPGPQGEDGESAVGSVTPETKTANFPVASGSLHAYRCTASLTATMPDFADAEEDILIEIRAFNSAIVEIVGDATFDGDDSITLLGTNKEGVRLRKGPTEWEAWG